MLLRLITRPDHKLAPYWHPSPDNDFLVRVPLSKNDAKGNSRP